MSNQPIVSASSIMNLPNANFTAQLPIKLNTTNYLLWQAQLMPLLRSYDLSCHIDGTAPPAPFLADEQPNPIYHNWYRHDQLVLTWIIGSVSENFLSQIVNVTCAREAWNKLSSAYSSGSKAQIRTLKSGFYRIQKEPAESIAVYVQRAKSIFDQLLALGNPILEDDLVQVITNGLDFSYRPFLRSLENRLDTVGFDDLYGLLLSEETSLTNESARQNNVPAASVFSAAMSSQNPSSSAFAAHHQPGGRYVPPYRGRSSRYRGRGRYSSPNNYRGSSVNQSANWNYTAQPIQSASPNSSPHPDLMSVTCFNCNGNGHYANTCSSPRQRREQRSNHHQPVSNLATTTNIHPQSWILDSGATHHITSDINNMSAPTEYSGPDGIKIGDGYPHETGYSFRPE